MDPTGIEPVAFRMRSERDAATPRTHYTPIGTIHIKYH